LSSLFGHAAGVDMTFMHSFYLFSFIYLTTLSVTQSIRLRTVE